MREEHERLDLNLEELAQLKCAKIQTKAELLEMRDKAMGKQKDWQGKIRKVQKDFQAEVEMLETLRRNHGLLKEDSAMQGESANPGNQKAKN